MPNMTTILVIDDDDDMRETLRLILEKEGYRLLTASNGNEAEECKGQSKSVPAGRLGHRHRLDAPKIQ